MNRSTWLSIVLVVLDTPCARAAEPLRFETHVRPILKTHCFDCHGEGDKLNGGLDLRLRRLIAAGGKSGPALVAGKPGDSLIHERVRKGEMPPTKKKLAPEEMEILRRWIAEGAPTAGPEPEKLTAGMHISAEDRAFWAFQPRRPRTAVPQLSGVRNPIDAFLLDRMRAQGLAFAPAADRRTLLRRATLDLIGLPPTPDEVQAFLDDAAPDAWEKVIDRLLAAPRYGERWGRHWLDVAGYADSEGYAQADLVRVSAWKYRDYVIRAFNTDKPFDQFIVEQLAGDELVRPPYQNLAPDAVDKLTATGFLRMAPDGTSSPGVDQTAARNQVVTDTIKIVSTAFLGLTVGCAQCHNHRYDPIPQTDFYRLRALLEPAYDVKSWKGPAARQVSLLSAADRRRAADIEIEAAKIDKERVRIQDEFIESTFQKELAKLPEALREPVRAARKMPVAKQTAEQKKLLREHPSVNVTAGSLYLYDSKAAAELKKMVDAATAIRATKPVEEFVRALTEVPGQVPATFLFHRGDPDQPKQAVAPGGLTILDERLPFDSSHKDAGLTTTGRRLAFARWLTRPDHPLTARVLVNRVWMHHFGRGLVATPGDFGRLGERPTHPELLDWLASEFIARGWKMKELHRLVMTSTAYRQSSRRAPARDGVDPDNKLLSRYPIRRLEAEAIRDGVLALSGQLTPRQYGPPVPVKENEVGQFVLGIDNKDGAGRFTAEVPLPPGDEFRRSIYIQVRRSRPYSVLDTFDAPTPEPNCELRNTSTVTPQALLLMNGEFLLTQADAIAMRVRRESGPDVRAQVLRTWRLIFVAEPSERELREALAFVAAQTETFRTAAAKDAKAGTQPEPAQRALATFCQALLSANRFLYVE